MSSYNSLNWENIFDETKASQTMMSFREDDDDLMQLIEDMFRDFAIVEKKIMRKCLGEEWVLVTPTKESALSEHGMCPESTDNIEDYSTPIPMLKSKAAQVIYNPHNKETSNKYSRYAKKYLEYVANEGRNDLVAEETMLCNFFHDRIESKKIGLGSIWSVYAIFNNFMKRTENIDLNRYRMLWTMMKNLTATYIPKQSDTITVEEFWQQINFLMEMDDEAKEGILMLVCMVLMWYGILRALEMFLIQIRSIIMDCCTHRIWVHFTRATKTRVKPFKFSVPEIFFNGFLTYFDQLSKDAQPETPLLKRFAKKYGD